MKRIFPIFLSLTAAATSAFASLDTGLIALLPAGSKVVAGIDVDKCRSSDFGQYILTKSQANDQHFDEFMNQTGFDPRRDLESLLVASPNDGGTKNSSFTILARGNFDQDKISKLALSKGAVASSYQNINLWISKDHGQSVALAFPDVGIAVMGDVASVQQVIQNLTSPANLDLDLTNHIDAAGNANDAWFVSATGGAALGKQIGAQTGGQMNGQMQALQSIRSASGGVKFGANITVSLDANTRSAQDATSLADVFRFMASMVQMQRQKDPKAGILASALDNMQLATKDDSLHVSFSMSEKNLEQIADMSPQVKH
jgi:hypothetical protein